MPLQFRCQACDQPIEVDDDASGQMVICPFCRKMGPAPAFSDPTIHHGGPVAAPQFAASPSHIPAALAGPALSARPPSRPAGRNILGWLSLVSGSLAVLLLFIAAFAIASTVGLAGMSGTLKDQMEQSNQVALENPWIMVVNLAGSLLIPLVGVILGTISVGKGGRPRWPAIVGLVICGGLLLLQCLGGLAMMALM